MNNNYLIHHGVKGQRWGIRRTAQQLGHTIKAAVKKSKNAIISNVSKKVKPDKATTQITVAEKKEQILKSRSAAELYKHADLFTTQELQSAYNRLQLERNIANLIPRKVSTGEQFVNTLQKTSNALQTSANAVQNGTKLYNNVAKIINSAIDDDNDKLKLIDTGGNKNKSKK